MLSYNRIAYELDGIHTTPDDVDGLSMLQHFDYPETWCYNGNASIAHEGVKFGKGCAYFPDPTSSVSVTNTTGMFDIDTQANYELEAFVKLNQANLEAQGYSFYNGHTFKAFDVSVSWSEAEAACEALGGHLATAPNAEKNAFLLSIVSGEYPWLGGQMVDDVWQWITGETWDYTNWGTSEPYVQEGYVFDKLYFYHTNGTWGAGADADKGPYICEWDYDLREGNILSLSGTVQNTTQTTSRLSGYSYYEGHTFKYYSTAKTWADAKAACEALGGHLATSTSAEKNAFLHSLIGSDIWLGATDEAKEGTWQWVTGEAWSYTNWENTAGEPNDTDSTQNYLMMYYNKNSPGTVCPAKWNDEVVGNTHFYICEWDYELTQTITPAPTEDALVLAVSAEGSLHLSCPALDIDTTTADILSTDTWYHLLLRIRNETCTLYVDGSQALSLTAEGTISTEAVTLGGYVGYMDEFAFRRNAGSKAPEVPAHAYDTDTETGGSVGNAPVSRVAWSCENLPEGLTLSSAGVLSGHPTTAGTYECEFSVATNWGTNTKTIRIVIE